MEIAAEGLVDARAEAVFAFLSDLGNHWLLADRFVELLSVHPTGTVGQGGEVRLRGPVMLHRTASTRVLRVSPPGQLVGTAEVRHRTRAMLRWTVCPHGNATAVRLSATVLRLGVLDRLPLAVDGGRWLRRRFTATIARLDEHVAAQDEGASRRDTAAPPKSAPASGARRSGRGYAGRGVPARSTAGYLGARALASRARRAPSPQSPSSSSIDWSIPRRSRSASAESSASA